MTESNWPEGVTVADTVAAARLLSDMRREALRNAPKPAIPGLYRMSELPAPSPAEELATARVRKIGEKLFEAGGSALMLAMFHAVLETHDERSEVLRHEWDGIGGWRP